MSRREGISFGRLEEVGFNLDGASDEDQCYMSGQAVAGTYGSGEEGGSFHS